MATEAAALIHNIAPDSGTYQVHPDHSFPLMPIFSYSFTE
jgi:hypothetical protein